MPTLAMIALAILSLLAGSLIEPPAAKAAGKPKPAINSAETIAPDAGFRVASEDVSATSSTRFVAVVLPRRVAETELGRMAEQARASEKAPYEKTVVNFYLPGMRIGQGAWAVATFNPALKVVVVGLRLDEEQTASAEAAADRRTLVGVWLTSPPAPAGRLTIYKDAAKTFAEWRLRDGTKSVEEVVEQRDGRGRRLTPASGSSLYFLLASGGELELRDDHALIATAERLRVVGEAAPEKVEKPAPKVAHQQPKPRRAVVPTSSASAGQALSQQVFKF